MPLRRIVDRLTKTVEELDREALADFVDRLDVVPMDHVVPRTPVRVGGEVRSVRIVPRAGAPALEVLIGDGRGQATAVFLGRRKIGGIAPGRRLVVEGVAAQDGSRILIVNPTYSLLP
jgi:hypothetical protein